jgi:hypothetical protein
MADDRPLGERVAVTEADIRNLARSVDGIREDVKGLTAGAWGLAVILLGFLAVQVYNTVSHNNASPPQMPTFPAAASAPRIP